MSDIGAGLADGLWRRLRDVILVAERIDTFAFQDAVAPERIAFDPAEAEALAADFTIRALASAADPLNWRILAACAANDQGATLGALAEDLGVPRLVVSERVVELLQAGLVVRALDEDRAQATAAGAALVTLVAGVTSELSARIQKARGETGTNGLPIR